MAWSMVEVVLESMLGKQRKIGCGVAKGE